MWQQGWRNLHHRGPTHLGATFRVDDARQPLEIKQAWTDGASFDEHAPRTVSGSRTTWEELRWDTPLEQFRPILSHTEPGTMFSSRAAALYEALSSILGLEFYDSTLAVLRAQRLSRERAAKDERRERTELRAQLTTSEDGRAAAAAALLGSRKPDTDAVLECAGDPDTVEADDLSALPALEAPTPERVAQVFDEADAARIELGGFAADEESRSENLATILEQALEYRHHCHEQAPADCPVCGAEQRLDDDWASHAGAQAAELRERGRAFRQARSRQSEALAAARHQLFSGHSGRAIAAAARCRVDTRAADALWTQWCELCTDDLELLTRGPELAVALSQELEKIQRDVAAQRNRRDEAWGPLRQAILTWHSHFLLAKTDGEIAATLKRAEAWLSDQLVALRQERLAPVVDAAKANWGEIQQGGEISLEHVELKKQGSQRFVSFDVVIDGADTSAFGVMSQGELSALAISVFLPRAMLAGSPFRFMVIDDPVQSLDATKVDGLARVLARAATQRQVIVLTHDARLLEAVRRVGIEACVMLIRREACSKVEITRAASPNDLPSG